MRRNGYIKCLAVAALFAAIIGYSVFSDVPQTDAEPPRTPVWLEDEPYLDFDANDLPAPATEAQRAIPTGYNMPLYLQDDPQWGGIEYAGSSISQAGCGLVCAAMAIDYLTNQITYPRDLAAVVGDTCLTDGVNDPGKFCAYAEEAYGLDGSEIYWTLDEALAECADGAVVFAGMTGQLGGQGNCYGGHVVLLWQSFDGDVRIRDPKSGDNSQRPYSDEELNATQWLYFYSLRSIK